MKVKRALELLNELPSETEVCFSKKGDAVKINSIVLSDSKKSVIFSRSVVDLGLGIISDNNFKEVNNE